MEKANEDETLDFKWLKKRGVGGKNKEIQFYESFVYDGVEYKLYDCVYMYKEGLPQPYIGKLIRIWELPEKTKKVKIHWFFLPGEISHWLRETETLENEIFLASGGGPCLAKVNPLEAIAGRCNVVCTSKDSRNPQPSDEELKLADFIFYRTFDVRTCTISDKIDDKVGGLEINYIFNRNEGEKSIPLSANANSKDENSNTISSSETQNIITKIIPNEDPKVAPQDNGISNLKRNMESDMSNDRPLKKLKSDDKCVEPGVVSGSEKMTDMPPVNSKNKKSDDKSVEHGVASGSEKKTDMPSVKSKNKKSDDKSVEPGVVPGSEKMTNVPSLKSKKLKSNDTSIEHGVVSGSENKTDLPTVKSKNLKSDDKSVEHGVVPSSEKKTDMPSMKSKKLISNDSSVEPGVASGSEKKTDISSVKSKKFKSNGKFVEPGVASGSVEKTDMPSVKSKNKKSDDNSIEPGVVSASEKKTDMSSVKSKKLKSNDKSVESEVVCGLEKKTDLPSVKPKVDKAEMKVSIAHVEKVENTNGDKTPSGSDKLHNQPSKKIKSGDKKPPEEKPVQAKVAWESEKSTVEIKSKQGDKLHADVPEKSMVEIESKHGDKLHADVPEKSTVEIKSKQGDKLHADFNNLKASGTSGTNENKKNGKISGKMTDDMEGKKLKKLKKMKDNGTSIVSNSKKICNANEIDSVPNSALTEEKVKSGNLDSNGNNGKTNNMEVEKEESGEKKNRLSVNKSFKATTDKDKKKNYDEFDVTRRPNNENSTWFRQLPWEGRLKEAYDERRAILLHNLKPDYTSEDVEDIIWHAFEVTCDAKILPCTAASSPHYVQALVLLKTKEAAHKILTKLDEDCLMIVNGRPLVGTPCPPISTKKNSTFLGHLVIDKSTSKNHHEDEAVSTSHFSQPNTIEYDMAMEWCLQQLRSEKSWIKLHKQQGLELKKLEKDLKPK